VDRGRLRRPGVGVFALTVELDLEDLGRVLFCHGSPRSAEQAITTVTPDERLHRALDGIDADVIVCGHTHVQFHRRLGARRVLNAGSVGMPYQGRPGTYWLLLGPDVELRRTDYDLAAAIERLPAAGWPELEEFLTNSFLEPLDPVAVSELVERQAQEAESPPAPVAFVETACDARDRETELVARIERGA
jgi:diadenosine tetraphosphatase ApaH/serine/threonine PP2A family protein phosphatase